MDEDWDSDCASGMGGLSISNTGVAIGRGRGFDSRTTNGLGGFGNSFMKTNQNNNIHNNNNNNNNEDDWDEDDSPAVTSTGNSVGWKPSFGSSNSYDKPRDRGGASGGSRGVKYEAKSNKRGKPSTKGRKNKKDCFNCGESGHMSRECPNPKKSGGRSCYKCGEEGHMSRECPNQNSSGFGGGSDRACFKCNQTGHISRDCPSGGGGGGGGNRSCYKCGEEGHISRDCPSGGGGGGGGGNRSCYKCGEEGHISRDCPSGGGGGGSGNKGCFKCGEEGHMSRDCTNEAKTDGDKPPPSTYEPEEIPDDEEHLFERGINSGIHFDKYDNIKVKMSGNNIVSAINSFTEARFTNLLQENIKRANYIKPTPIQKCAIPVVLQGRDLMGCAQTGSGKTAAFLLPMIEYMLRENVGAAEYKEDQEPTAIIVAPTRELALQIHNEARKFAYRTNVRSVVVYGGTAVSFQLSNLMNGCHILVATPGRLMDFINRRKVGFGKLKFLVLDEADRMLDMGFMPDVRKLCAHAAVSTVGLQTLMFSATFPAEIQELAGEFLNDYLFLAIGQVGGANSDVKQTIYQVSQFEKREKLVDILKQSPNDRTLVFVGKKRIADFLATYLCQEKLRTTSIHGDRAQREREEAIADFRSGRMPILTATAVAARGLDIKGVQHVINYDMPPTIDEYVHRIGRTGRVGNEGKATSFYDSSTDSAITGALIKILSDSQQEVPDWLQNNGSMAGAMQNFGGSSGRGKFGARDVRSKANNNIGNSGFNAFVNSAPDEEDWD